MKKFLILIAIVTTAFSAGMAQGCDTLFNLVSPLDTPMILSADTGFSAGYLAGNNIYGDIAKAEGFAVDSGSYVTSAYFYFGVVTINPSDSNSTVTLTVWDDTGFDALGNSAPGNVIDTLQVTLGQIAQAVSAGLPLQVYFADAPSLLTGGVFVGLVLPVIEGDTVALLTNTTPAGPDGNGWELGFTTDQTGNYIWGSYDNDYQFAGGSLGNYIGIIACNAPLSGAPVAAFTATNSSISACSPDDISFIDNTVVTGSTTYTWSFGDGNTSNAQNTDNTFAAGGTYIVTESVTSNTGSVIQVFVNAYDTITISSGPTINVTETDATSDSTEGFAYITVTDGSGHHFTSWSDGSAGDTLLSGDPGTYAVTVVDQNGCIAQDSVTISFPTTIINLSAAQQLTVYPVPATTVLNLVWSQQPDATVSIIDLNGSVVSSLAISRMNTAYDIHTLVAGAYILRITDRKTNRQQSLPFSKF